MHRNIVSRHANSSIGQEMTLFIVLSPAKTLNENVTNPQSQTCTDPKLWSKALSLAQKLQSYSPSTLKDMYKVNPSIAKLNHDRWKNFEKASASPAVLTFNGPAFKGINATSFTTKQWKFASDHVGILCALYGILRPLDGIKPYRLEIGTKLPDKTSLYNFWKDEITNEIVTSFQSKKQKVLLNLASQEYYKSINEKILNDNDINVITCIFKDDGKIKSVYAKEARGLMTRYVVQHEIDDVEELKKFNVEGYVFNKKESDDSNLVFHRSNKKRKRGG